MSWCEKKKVENPFPAKLSWLPYHIEVIQYLKGSKPYCNTSWIPLEFTWRPFEVLEPTNLSMPMTFFVALIHGSHGTSNPQNCAIINTRFDSVFKFSMTKAKILNSTLERSYKVASFNIFPPILQVLSQP